MCLTVVLIFQLGLAIQTSNQTETLQCKIDSLVVELQKQPDTVFIEKPVERPRQINQRRVKFDSTQTANTEHVLFIELLKDGVDSSMARIIIAIAKHESGSFNSGLTRRSNNLFGMTWPQLRPSTAIGHIVAIDHGNVRRFCTYSSLSSSIHDMVLYLKHWNYPLNIKTPEAMVSLMKHKGYFEASERLYLKAVKRHLNTLTI